MLYVNVLFLATMDFYLPFKYTSNPDYLEYCTINRTLTNLLNLIFLNYLKITVFKCVGIFDHVRPPDVSYQV